MRFDWIGWSVLLCLFVSALAPAKDPEFPTCAKAITSWLDQRQPERHWTAARPGVYRAPSKRLGEWWEARVGTRAVEIRKVSDTVRESTRWALGSCLPEIDRRPTSYDAARMRAAFSDETLRAIVARHRAGIIYAWSPAMPLSAERAVSVQAAAKRLGIPVFFVLDPYADRKAAAAEARQHELPFGSDRPMESIELFYRGMLNHFPSVLVFSHGQWKGTLIPGWKHEAAYFRMVRDRLHAGP